MPLPHHPPGVVHDHVQSLLRLPPKPHRLLPASLHHRGRRERALLSVNRQLSGPGIHVCEGDTVIAEVHNFMENGRGTSVHWHGMHQVGTQHMDARFHASPAGTHYWHSHSGLQRSEAIFGPLWSGRPRRPTPACNDTDQPEHTLLALRLAEAPSPPAPPAAPKLPATCSEFAAAFAHRVRVISNAILNCPFVLSVANHSLLVIATDGAPVVPIESNSLIIYAGERFDFVLTADPTAWQLPADGGRPGRLRLPLHHGQSAIVSYAGIDETPLQGAGNPAYSDMLGRPGGRQLNPFNRAPDANHIDVTSLRTPAGWPPADHLTVDGPVDAKFYLAFDFEVVNNSRYHHPAYYPISAVRKSDGHLYTPQINNVALHMPPAPLLYQFDDVLQSHICNNTDFDPAWRPNSRPATHALRLGVNKTVSWCSSTKGSPSMPATPVPPARPFLRVIGMEKLGKNVSVAEVKRRTRPACCAGIWNRPVMKDTFHVEIGMGLLLLVDDAASWSAGVPANSRACGQLEGSPGPDRRWQQRELRLAETHRLQHDGSGLLPLALCCSLPWLLRLVEIV
uniref:Multicopper oxidase n=1 Tax=Macrostomum lignano TaxID=282301 RepID=A0A1I8FDJ8_9PLAT